MQQPVEAMDLTQESFFKGFLAALALHKQTLQATRSELHQAFFSAVTEAEHRAFIRLDDLEIDFDSLYEVSPWFDRALTRAQRDLLVSFPNPSYERIQISFAADEASSLLDGIGHRSQFERIAADFFANLQK